jgi:hypothetical protein
LPLFRELIRERFEAALTGRKEIREAPDDVERAIQEARYQRVERRLSDARLLGDGVIAAFFSAEKPRAREAKRQEIESWLNEPTAAMWMKVGGLARSARGDNPPVTPFHWELEFPEVFARANPGFDSVVGNPPYLGGKRISSEYGDKYRDWLACIYERVGQNSDLIAYFARRCFVVLRDGGIFGIIATKTISQGDTREGGLAALLKERGTIIRAVRRIYWPGDAAVIVSRLHVLKGHLATADLDGRKVRRISAYLMEGDLDRTPVALNANRGKAFQGSIVLGTGFIFADHGAAGGSTNSLAEMIDLFERNPRNRERIYPYLGGEDLNNDPKQTGNRFIIDFADEPEEFVRKNYPDLISLLEKRVKPERQKQKREDLRRRWWQFAYRKNQLYTKSCNISHVFAMSQATKHLGIARVESRFVFDQKTVVFPYCDYDVFTTIQCRIHDLWFTFFATTLGDTLNYSIGDCFETFPFPESEAIDPELATRGQAYYDHRGAVMIARNEGLTRVYNRFHGQRENAADIVRLRELHAELDRAVLRTYGWDDLAERAEPQFLDETNEDDHKYQGRLFWPAEFRDEVLARLLALNAERAAAEREIEHPARTPRGLLEAELLESVAADEND